MPRLEIGIAFDLRDEHPSEGPDDLFEEYDSPATIEAVAAALEANRYATRLLGGGRDFLTAVLEDPPDLVFNMAEGAGGRSREAFVPAVCERLGIACTGSDPLTLAAALDKPTAKRLVAGAGVPTAPFVVLDAVPDTVALRFPVIAKPVAEGSGMGLRPGSRIEEISALRAEAGRLLDGYRQPVLVEEFCPGPELTVGILGTGSDAAAVGVMEVSPKHVPIDEFVYSVQTKREGFDAVEYLVPPPRPAQLVERTAEVALAAHRALGCRDVSRVDLRVDAAGEPVFLEANPLPGLAPDWGDIVVLARRAGIGYEDFIGRIVAAARRRLGI